MLPNKLNLTCAKYSDRVESVPVALIMYAVVHDHLMKITAAPEGITGMIDKLLCKLYADTCSAANCVLLQYPGFVCIGNGIIVNLKYKSYYNKSDKELVMLDGTSLPVAKDYRKQFLSNIDSQSFY